MSRIGKCGLIQAKNAANPDDSITNIKRKNIDLQLKLIDDAAKGGMQILCLQEIFYGPYFPAEKDTKWYDMAEPIPDGDTIIAMIESAEKNGIVLVVPIMEKALEGLFYNTAAVISAYGDGELCTR